MLHQVGPDVAATGHDIEHAGGQTRRQRCLGHEERVEDGLLRRLQHDRASGRQRGREFEEGDRLWDVPGDDRADHADRAAGDACGPAEHAGPFVHRRGVDHHLAEVAQQNCGKCTLELLGEPDRHAVLDRDPARGLGGAGLEFGGEPVERLGTLLGVPTRPAGRVVERPACRGDGVVDVARGRGGNTADRVLGRGGTDGDRGVAGAALPAAVDVELAVVDRRHLAPWGSRGNRRPRVVGRLRTASRAACTIAAKSPMDCLVRPKRSLDRSGEWSDRVTSSRTPRPVNGSMRGRGFTAVVGRGRIRRRDGRWPARARQAPAGGRP